VKRESRWFLDDGGGTGGPREAHIPRKKGAGFLWLGGMRKNLEWVEARKHIQNGKGAYAYTEKCVILGLSEGQGKGG